MQRKDLALRVLSTAAIMSIVTSIAAPAFADVYYIGNGSIDVEAITENGKQYVKVTQGETTYTDTSDEIVIKDGTSEANATLKEANRAAGTQATSAVAPAATPATQELEATGSADAAGESQPDPDAGFTQNETGEDSAQTQEGNNPTEDTSDPSTENPTEDTPKPPKKDGVYQYDPAADPNPEQQATKLAPTSADPAAETREAALAPAPAADPAPTTPAEGSAEKPTTNVIKVVNNWVGEAAKELKIRLSNVNIKQDYNSKYADGSKPNYQTDGINLVSGMTVKGSGKTKLELDGKNLLDSTGVGESAGLYKDNGAGTLIITDETDDEGNEITAPKLESDTSGSLTAKGGGANGAAGIGGNLSKSTKNITIEGYATVDATGGGQGAGIGGGGGNAQGVSGNAENIIIQGHSKVTATAQDGAAIGGGSASRYGGSAWGIKICDHATVVAKNTGWGAAIGAAGSSGPTEAEVTIGTAGATAEEEEEDVHITATGLNGSAIGNGAKDTMVTIQGHVTIHTASRPNNAAIGSGGGNVKVNIKDNVAIDTYGATVNANPTSAGSSIGGGYIDRNSGRTVEVNIDGGKKGKVKLGEQSAITGQYGAISATKVKIDDNVLLKMKQRTSSSRPYIAVNGAEAAVGTRSNPAAGGLVNTIGDNTELWYLNEDDRPQKIVHGKNICKKSPKQNITKKPTCTESGSEEYTCDYEKEATHPSCNRTWTDELPALGHQWKEVSRTGNCGVAGEIHYVCEHDSSHTKTEHVEATGNHQFNAWHQTKAPTCMEEGEEKRECEVCGKPETHKLDKLDHVEELRGAKEPTCTEPGYTGDEVCDACGTVVKKGTVIPATGHHWVDKGDGTHTCPDCGATEGQPVNTNSALELRVVDAEGMDQPFTVSQNGTLRTYTGAYDTATLTGDLDTLRYLQDHGAQTIQFVTNGQTSSFVINDLLAQGSGSEVFYLTHRGTEEPTLLLVEADHSELVKD